jgi:hypothetical protein
VSSDLPQTREQTLAMTRRMVAGHEYRRRGFAWQLRLAVAITLAVARGDVSRLQELHQ